MGIEADRGEGEFGHMGLADDHGAGGAQSPDHDGVLLRHGCRALDDRAGERRFSGNVEKILDRNDLAVERSERGAGLKAAVGGIGLDAGAVGIELDIGLLVLPTGIEPAQDLFEVITHGSVRMGHDKEPADI